MLCIIAEKKMWLRKIIDGIHNELFSVLMWSVDREIKEQGRNF